MDRIANLHYGNFMLNKFFLTEHIVLDEEDKKFLVVLINKVFFDEAKVFLGCPIDRRKVKFGDWIFAPVLWHHNIPERFIGKVIQIRVGEGINNTDLILLRGVDGNIYAWQNQAFYSVPTKAILEIESRFKMCPHDSESGVYLIAANGDDHSARKGFIVFNKETH